MSKQEIKYIGFSRSWHTELDTGLLQKPLRRDWVKYIHDSIEEEEKYLATLSADLHYPCRIYAIIGSGTKWKFLWQVKEIKEPTQEKEKRF